jgi:hypothetical protein
MIYIYPTITLMQVSPMEFSQVTDLEYVGEVPEIEDIVELDGGGQESGGDLVMEIQCHIYQLLHALLDL